MQRTKYESCVELDVERMKLEGKADRGYGEVNAEWRNDEIMGR